MRNYTLGPAIETFGPNIRITALFAVGASFICLIAFGVAHETNDVTAWTIFLVVTALLGGAVLWQLSFRAAAHDTGVSSHNIFAAKEMRWHEIERVYFGCHELHAHYFPLGTFYVLKLRSVHGQSLSLSNHIRRAEDLALLISRYTLKPLLEKELQHFQSGQDISFDAIILNSTEGLTLRKLLADKRISWNEIESYTADTSFFEIHLRKRVFSTHRIRAEKIANLHILKVLLDSVMQKVWMRV